MIRITEFREAGELIGIGFLFLGSPDPWPQEVRVPNTDGLARFRSYRWCTREEVSVLEPRWEHDITRTAWPSEIVEPILDSFDEP